MKTALQEEKNRKAHMHMLVDNALELSVIVSMSTQHCDQVLENLLVQLFNRVVGSSGRRQAARQNTGHDKNDFP